MIDFNGRSVPATSNHGIDHAAAGGQNRCPWCRAQMIRSFQKRTTGAPKDRMRATAAHAASLDARFGPVGAFGQASAEGAF